MIRIDPDRLLADLDRLRDFGRCGNGVVRTAYSAIDIEARRWLAERSIAAGLTPVWDRIGNLFALPDGARPILIGSHADTQPEGGWLDGAFGVICGLEIARAAREAGIDRVASVAFADEESTFAGLLGSRVWTGALAFDDVMTLTDRTGRTLEEALAGVPEIANGRTVAPDQFMAFLEPHIEQGPVLDQTGERAGVVTAIVGLRHVDLVFLGDQNHAGTTPMAGRHDALKNFVRFSDRLDYELAPIVTPSTVWTIGSLTVEPNATSVIPGRVRAILQIRDAEEARLDTLAEIALRIARDMAAEGMMVVGAVTERLSPSPLDRNLVEILEKAAERRVPGGWRAMASGALHDAAPVSRLIPTAMVFAPSIGGKSHSFDEDTRPADLVTCCEIVADAVADALGIGA